MLLVTGDTHAKCDRYMEHIDPNVKDGDILFVVGDIGFYRNWSEEISKMLDYVESRDMTLAFIDGNHEDFEVLKNAPVSEWNGGKVHVLGKNIYHLMRGEIYEVEGTRIFTMGGALSRGLEGESAGELPNNEEYENAASNLDRVNHEVNVILTHTVPESTAQYLNFMVPGAEWKLRSFLQGIVESCKYDKWYCGHIHEDREMWKNQYILQNSIRNLLTGKIVYEWSY